MDRSKIIDAHCHVASTEFVPVDFFRGIARNMYAKAAASGHCLLGQDDFLKFLLNQHQDHKADQLVEEMDSSGIDQAILLLPDFTHVFKHHMHISDMVRLHQEIMNRHPGRFKLFSGVDPRSDNACEVFQSLVTKFTISGLKIYPPCGYSPSAEKLFPFYEVCQHHGLPVLLHTGPSTPTLRFNHAQPDLIDEAAVLFPKVNFILGHGGVNNVTECVQLCAFRDNVYLDFSAFTSTTHPKGWAVQLKELFSCGINHKIIFGTDWPIARDNGGLKRVLSKLLSPNGPFEGVTQRDRGNILFQNITNLLPST